MRRINPFKVRPATKTIELDDEFAEYTVIIPNIQIADAGIRDIMYTTIIGGAGATKIKEYRVLCTVQHTASFPLTLLYRDLQDVYGNDLPTKIEDAFVVGVQAVGFRREIHIVSYDEYELIINLGSRGESRAGKDIQITFVVKEG